MGANVIINIEPININLRIVFKFCWGKYFNLDKKKTLIAKHLSHGEKQWLEIAMLLGQDPDMLLVDEPVAGLTDEETELTADLLKSLAGR